MNNISSVDRWTSPGNSEWSILVRLMLAGVFIPEGIQKLIFPEILGTGRFIGIGIPWPEVMGPFVGWVEFLSGVLLLLGLFSRFAAVPIIVVMLVAIIATKIPILLGSDWLIFNVRELSRYGFWSMAHETRTDWAMLLGAIYVLLSGGGRWSMDNRLFAVAPSH